MEVEIRRTYKEKQTEGRLYVYNERNGVGYSCDTLELPWLDNKKRISCIPEGEYDVIKHVSPKFGECFWILDVPERSEILVHKGNYNRDTLGCVLVGKSLIDIDGDGNRDATNSSATMKELLKILPNKFKLNIR
jgi:hypothetical protein